MADPFTGFTPLPLLVEIGAAALAAIGGWKGFAKWILPKMSATGRALAGLMEVGTRADELMAGIDRGAAVETMVKSIKLEVMPNGGSSLRDSVARTEATVNLLVGQVRARADADVDTATLDCDGDGRVEWLSRALMTWTQRTSDELKGHGWISSIHPSEREDVAEEWARCIKYNRQFDSAFRLIDRDGDAVLVRMSAMPVTTRRTGTTNVVRWVATLRVINLAPDALLAPERDIVRPKQTSAAKQL